MESPLQPLIDRPFEFNSNQLLGISDDYEQKHHLDFPQVLTTHQTEILYAIFSHGLLNIYNISKSLNISERTFRTELSTIYSKIENAIAFEWEIDDEEDVPTVERVRAINYLFIKSLHPLLQSLVESTACFENQP